MSDIKLYLKKYLKEIIFGGLLLGCVTLTCYSIFAPKKDTQTFQNDNFLVNTEKEEKSETKPQNVHVDIKGAVKNPGVYEVEENSIVSDVITLAGGFNEDADKESINLSKKVSDEMVIYIYTTKEMAKNESKKNSSTSTSSCKSKSYNIKDCVEKKESIIIPGEGDNKTTSESEKIPKIININTATKEELMTLNGIGEVKAQAIIEYRNTNGNFKSIEEIEKVKGIGNAVFAKIKNYITI